MREYLQDHLPLLVAYTLTQAEVFGSLQEAAGQGRRSRVATTGNYLPKQNVEGRDGASLSAQRVTSPQTTEIGEN
jgi:hypothetical protein